MMILSSHMGRFEILGRKGALSTIEQLWPLKPKPPPSSPCFNSLQPRLFVVEAEPAGTAKGHLPPWVSSKR